jgi:hypothetical protein
MDIGKIVKVHENEPEPIRVAPFVPTRRVEEPPLIDITQPIPPAREPVPVQR